MYLQQNLSNDYLPFDSTQENSLALVSMTIGSSSLLSKHLSRKKPSSSLSDYQDISHYKAMKSVRDKFAKERII